MLHDESRRSVCAVFAVLRFYIPFRRERCSRHSEEEGSTGSIRETQGGFCTWTFFSHSGWARECLGSCVMVMSVIKRLSNPRIPRTARPRWPEPASRPLRGSDNGSSMALPGRLTSANQNMTGFAIALDLSDTLRYTCSSLLSR